jgi:CheY-like chemotaxis protein
VSERILVADDSLAARESVASALAARGSQLEVVADGHEALARLREQAADLLIADVHMPRLDGYALCRAAKAERPALRVLLLVGTFEPFDAGAAAAARSDGLVRKPFVPDDLLRQVEALLGRAAVSRRPREEAVAGPDPAAPPATPAPEPASGQEPAALSDADVDRIARRVLALGGGAVLERVARQVLGEAVAARLRGGAAGAAGPAGEPERE